MSVTNAIPSPEKRFTLAEMSAVMMDRKKVPVGFFVSQALWDGISARLMKEQGFGLGTASIDFHGIKCLVDPSMPDTEFDVAFTEDAWSKRALAISQVGGNAVVGGKVS